MNRSLVGLMSWLIVFVGSSSLLAAPVPQETKPKGMGPAERIHKELELTTSLEITDQPLSLAINQLRDQTKLNFVMDLQSMAQMGIDPDQAKVQVKVKDVKLKAGLRAILGSFNLNYVILGDVIFISTDDVTMLRQMQQRVCIDVEKVEFAKALKQLSRETATNLTIDPRAIKEANQLVTLQLEDVPLDKAVRLLCEIGGLKPVRVGNVLFVTTKTIAQEMNNDPEMVPGRPDQPGQPGVPGVVMPGVNGVVVNPAARVPAPPLPMNVAPPAAEKTDAAPGDNASKEKEKEKEKDKDKDKTKPAEPPAKNKDNSP